MKKAPAGEMHDLLLATAKIICMFPLRGVCNFMRACDVTSGRDAAAMNVAVSMKCVNVIQSIVAFKMIFAQANIFKMLQ